MRQANFREPNFQCRISDLDGKTSLLLTWALSEKEIRRRLLTLNYVIESIEPYDFQIWRDQVAAAKERILVDPNGNELTFDRELWSKLKMSLFESYNGKCAYCESRPLVVSSGDVEHFRPKKSVLDEPSHRGYYWLAYEIENLLPCCENCNRARGKSTNFPIQGQRAFKPEDNLGAESPILINPNIEDPSVHLAFVPGILSPGKFTGIGIVKGKTPRGEETIRICNLNRTPLVEERKTAQEAFFNQLLLAMAQFNAEKVANKWNMLRQGKEAYSASIIDSTKSLEPLGIVPTV